MAKTPQKNPSPIIDNTTLELKIPWDKIAPVYQKTLIKLASKLKLDGFRKGKAPLHIAKAQLDPEYLIQEVLNQVVPPLYVELINKLGKIPLSDPEFQPISLKENDEWQLSVVIAEKPPLSVKNYQKLVKSAKSEAQRKLEADKKTADKNKTAIKPSDPQSKLNEHDEQKKALSQAVFKTLIEEYQPKVPELLLKQETRHELQHFTERLQQSNMSLDDYLKKSNQAFSDLANQTAVYLLGKIQLGFIFDAVAIEAKITVSDQDLEKPLQQIPAPKRQDKQLLASLRSALLEQKVIDHLLNL